MHLKNSAASGLYPYPGRHVPLISANSYDPGHFPKKVLILINRGEADMGYIHSPRTQTLNLSEQFLDLFSIGLGACMSRR